MKNIKSQIMYNLKKDRGSFVSFGIVIFITALMLNLALVLVFQVDKAYDKKFEELDTATVNVCISQMQDTDTIQKEIEKIEGVVKVESREAIFVEAVVKDFRATDFSMNTMFYNLDEIRNLNKMDIQEENSKVSKKSIYLPLYVSSFGEFGLNDEIVYEIGGKKHTFVVDGVLEEMQYGNYGKGLMGAYLPKTVFEELAEEYEMNMVVEYSVLGESGVESNFLYNEIAQLLEDKDITLLTGIEKNSTKDARTMVCNLLILVLTAFSIVILLVSVFLCKFRISNSIEEEMVNMGILKAMGYTGNMIISSVVLPYLMVTLLAAILGVGVSYVVLPVLSEVLTLQAGFSFKLLFDYKALICAVVILECMVTLFTYMAARGIRKLQPINAIRGNGEEKKIKKNYLPLESTKGKTKFLLIMKQMLSSGKQNVLLFGVSFVLTILIAFASTMFYNVIIKPNNFISTLSEEMPQIMVYPKSEAEDDLVEDLQLFSKVEKVLKYTVGTMNIDDIPVTVFASEDFNQVSNDLCYLGENPQNDNEIALGSAFEGMYEIGDSIKVINGENACVYKITGFIQSVNYQGNVCEFTLEGYEELLDGKPVPSIYVYLEDGTDAEAVIKEIDEKYEEQIVNQVNYQKMTETTREMYSGITSIMIIVIFVLTILVVLFVLYIVIKTLLVQRKKELGIYKAIGYSNGQLMFQMIGSFLPSSVLAVLVSSVLGLIYVPEIIRFIFSSIGAMKNNMEVSLAFLMVFALVQITASLVISIALTKPIKKISAYALIKEN